MFPIPIVHVIDGIADIGEINLVRTAGVGLVGITEVGSVGITEVESVRIVKNDSVGIAEVESVWRTESGVVGAMVIEVAGIGAADIGSIGNIGVTSTAGADRPSGVSDTEDFSEDHLSQLEVLHTARSVRIGQAEMKGNG